MSGEAWFWIFTAVFTVAMIIGFLLLDRPRKSRGVPTTLSVDSARDDPRGRHRPAERVDPSETDSRL